MEKEGEVNHRKIRRKEKNNKKEMKEKKIKKNKLKHNIMLQSSKVKGGNLMDREKVLK